MRVLFRRTTKRDDMATVYLPISITFTNHTRSWEHIKLMKNLGKKSKPTEMKVLTIGFLIWFLRLKWYKR